MQYSLNLADFFTWISGISCHCKSCGEGALLDTPEKQRNLVIFYTENHALPISKLRTYRLPLKSSTESTGIILIAIYMYSVYHKININFYYKTVVPER